MAVNYSQQLGLGAFDPAGRMQRGQRHTQDLAFNQQSMDMRGTQFNQQQEDRLAQQEQAQKQAQYKQKVNQQAVQYLENGEFDKLQGLMIENPEMRKGWIESANFKDEQALNARVSHAKSILAGSIDPIEALDKHIASVEAAGGDASGLKSIERTPEAIKKVATMDLMMLDNNAYKAFIGNGGQDTPAAVQETEWYNNQTPEVQEAHLKVKRGETLSQEEQLSLDKAKSEIKIRESMILDATKMSKEAIGKIDGLRSSIGTIESAIAEVDNGATVGKIESFLPSFKASTIALQNLGNKMGLDIVSATTFGALSEGELRLAMSTAMPQFNNSKDLRGWLVDKKKSQQKLMGELRKMAIKLGSGKITPSEYLEQNGYSEAVSWSDL